MRYLVQAWRTWKLLRQERPDLIFVQNPPIFAVMVACIYSRIHGAQYVIDSHTGAFRSSYWRWSVGLHRLLSRGALATIVHNESQGGIVKNWGCTYRVLSFVGGEYPDGEQYALSDHFNVAVVCGFDADEPTQIVFEAARLLPDVRLYITGDAERIDERLLRDVPVNIRLTGYLPYEEYVGLLRGVNAIMDLVEDQYTLLMGGFEAIALGTPLIVSDWPLLRDFFSKGTVYVQNTAEGIHEGVRIMQRDSGRLKKEISMLRDQFQDQWERDARELLRLWG